MITTPDNPLTQESDANAGVQPHKGRTWFPILLGVLCGMIACLVLANLESPSFYRLSVWIFNETSPKALFVMPAYYYLQYAILITLAGVGGCIGVLFSRWRKRTAFLFLLAILVVIAVFAALGNYLDRSVR